MKTGTRVAIAALACAGTAAAPAAASAAEVLYGVTDANRLVRFASDGPGDVAEAVQITGLLSAGERVVGIDVRPADDTLYAVTTGNRVYTVNPVTGSARPAVDPIATPLRGALFGVDFNPVADALRITSDDDQNLRIRFSDRRTFDDGALNHPDGTNPAVTASAYTNSVPGATSTTLLGLDVARDALVRQDPPNAGTLTVVGALGLDVADAAGFDIARDGTAYAALVTQGQTVANLHRIDLATGRATPAAAAPAIALPQGSGTLRGLAAAGATSDDRTPPGLSVAFSSTILERNARTLRPSVSCDESCTVTVAATVDGRRAGRATAAVTGGAGRVTVAVPLSRAARARIARRGTELIRLTVTAVDAAGNRRSQDRVSRTQTLAARRAG
jgi:3D (Asp-Asp-Asp) domain-containing protein